MQRRILTLYPGTFYPKISIIELANSIKLRANSYVKHEGLTVCWMKYVS